MSTVDIEALKKRISDAKASLVITNIFFGSAGSRRPIILSDDIPTACVYATGQIKINPHFADRLTRSELVFLIAHECCHWLFGHFRRLSDRDPKLWNIAGDKWINATLKVYKVGDMPKGGIDAPGSEQYSTEELYEELERDQRSGGGTDGGSGDPMGGDLNPDQTDADGNKLSKDELEAASQEATATLIQSAKLAKDAGNMPAGLVELVEAFTQVRTPWHRILANRMTRLIREGKTWKRPNRRHVHRGVYLKGPDRLPKMGTIVVGADSSNSVSMEEWKVFGGHFNRILETCQPEKVVVIYCDAEVQKVEEYTPDDFPVQFNRYGSGGTKFKPVFEEIDERGIKPEVVVYLTDGEGDQHHFTSDHPTVWLTTACTDFPWGEVVKFDLDD